MKNAKLTKQIVAIISLISVAIFTTAADNHDHNHDHEKSESTKESKSASEEGSTVSVRDDGKKFDPSVPASKIPEGAWFCEMSGKSHYAQGEKGKCPICGMKLKQK